MQVINLFLDITGICGTCYDPDYLEDYLEDYIPLCWEYDYNIYCKIKTILNMSIKVYKIRLLFFIRLARNRYSGIGAYNFKKV